MILTCVWNGLPIRPPKYWEVQSDVRDDAAVWWCRAAAAAAAAAAASEQDCHVLAEAVKPLDPCPGPIIVMMQREVENKNYYIAHRDE